jgi:hypothetical protein
VAYGTVTGVLYVNGDHYDTSKATFKVDDQIATGRDLHVGDVVRVLGQGRFAGSIYRGDASSVDVRHALHGAVSAVDPAGASFVVLGQTVVINAETILDVSVPKSLAELAVGDVVEVAGLPGRDDKVFASRITKKPLGPLGLKVAGTATNVDPDQPRFTINGLVVDFGRAWVRLSNGTVLDGDRVEVLGSSLGANGELVAREIRPDDLRDYIGAAGTLMRLEGVIAAHEAASSPPTFMLHGIRVMTYPSTTYEGPTPSSWLDARVDVTGVVQPDNSVVASAVRFAHPSPVQMRARVDSVNAAAGSLVVLGIPIEARPFTRITDESAIRAQPFGLSALAPGDYVHVAGAETHWDSGIVVASLVERLDAQDETRLQGRATSHTGMPGPLFMLGVTVNPTGATRYPTPNGGELTSWTFFDSLTPHSIVEARGIEVADREIVASELRLEWRR